MSLTGEISPKAAFGEAWGRLFDPPIAHRGLWSPGGAPENSLAAFQAACAGGYGIELDVQLSADGEAMVFHDTKLERMTGAEGRLSDHKAGDLTRLALLGTDETIPTLSETLTLVGHRAMVLIEIKAAAGDVGALEKRVHEVLIDHNGPTAVIGFNPYSHGWFAQHHPKILRGLNSHAYAWSMSRPPSHTSWPSASICCLPSAPTPCARAACRWSPGPCARRSNGGVSKAIATT